jgi:tetratricopeptide (TPR) repeat protein
MSRSTPIATCLVTLLSSLMLVAPLSGCSGTKKKASLTIAERLAKARGDTTPGGQARELAKIARLQFKSGDKTGAGKTLAEARKTINADADPTVFGPRLVDIATTYVILGDKKPAREVADRALALADTMTDAVAQTDLLAKVGVVYGSRETGLGDAIKAKETLAKAAAIASGDQVTERFRPQALAAVALGYANANLAADATPVIEKLETLAASLTDLRPKAEALAAAANVYAKSGAQDKAAALLVEAAKAARQIDSSANKAYALIAVGNAANVAGDKKAAAALAAEAEKTTGKIADPEQQKDALQDVRALQAAIKK